MLLLVLRKILQYLNIRNIIIGLVVLFLFVVIGYILYLKNTIKNNVIELNKANSLLVQYKQALAFQNSQILANAQDKQKLSDLPKELTKIQTRYQVVYSTIEKIKEQKDEDCSTAINQLNTFAF